MTISRRDLIRSSALLTAASALPLGTAADPQQPGRGETPANLPPAIAALASWRDRMKPITVEEFQGRIQHAQKLMSDLKPGFDALYVTPGTTLYYFTGIRWGLSERVVALTIPRSGDPLLICPGFEEGRLRELMRFPIELRVWQEDDNPGELVAKWLTERGIRAGRIGIEETTRYTYYDKLRHAAPELTYAIGDPVTIGCRGNKSEHELELMRLACAVTFEAYRATFASVQEGMTQYDINGLLSAAFSKLGFPSGGGLILIGKWAALPHGTTQPQKLVEGQILQIDAGTNVDGYESDVTRCYVLGEPSEKYLRAFDTVHKAQEAALNAARRGHECGSVDAAARAVITNAGYGNLYEHFTHRLGHGIGLDGHEWPYLVRGNKRLLDANQTFSNEPGIYIVDDFGLRLEDDMVVMPDGPARLLTPGLSESLKKPV